MNEWKQQFLVICYDFDPSWLMMYICELLLVSAKKYFIVH